MWTLILWDSDIYVHWSTATSQQKGPIVIYYRIVFRSCSFLTPLWKHTSAQLIIKEACNIIITNNNKSLI